MNAENMGNFTDVTVLITGGATGIGFAIASKFASLGSKLVLVDRSKDTHQKAIDMSNDFHIEALGIEADITDNNALAEIKKKCLEKFPCIDVLVNNAGVAFLDKAETLSAQKWHNTLAVNISAAFFITQTFVPEMIERGKGKIVNIASQAGVVALDRHIAYCVSKAGIISMTKVMALEWGKYNINVNAVSPTVVLTELGKKVWGGQVGEDMKAKIPLKRFVTPEEIASLVVFLSSSVSDMIHGENILIDGGYTVQ